MTADAQALRDRLEIEDTIYRYASCIDRRDLAGVRATLADDLVAQYGNSEPIHGGETVANWIDEMTRDCLWQHHLLNVYHVHIDGDRADVLVYHTSHQLYVADPETVHVLVARYHNEVQRGPDGWRISKLLMEILWAERRTDPSGFLADVGGRGPVL